MAAGKQYGAQLFLSCCLGDESVGTVNDQPGSVRLMLKPGYLRVRRLLPSCGLLVLAVCVRVKVLLHAGFGCTHGVSPMAQIYSAVWARTQHRKNGGVPASVLSAAD